MDTMKAIRVLDYGDAAALRYEDVPRPEPQPGEALVRVRAAGVNPIDWKVCAGLAREWLPLSLPVIPGWDLSGEVAALGDGATGLAVGDEVIGYLGLHHRQGAYAEYVAAPTEILAPRSPRLDHAHAAAVPLAALTAWQALFERAALQSGQRVLILGGAGGVGHFAVQLARWAGAHVVATTSRANLEFVHSLGAATVIDYTRARLEEAVEPVDAVFDTVGGAAREPAWRVIRPGGVLVTIVGKPAQETAAAHGVRATSFLVRPDGEQLRRIVGLLDEGHLRVELAATYPLAEAGRAHERSRGGHVRGKLALVV